MATVGWTKTDKGDWTYSDNGKDNVVNGVRKDTHGYAIIKNGVWDKTAGNNGYADSENADSSSTSSTPKKEKSTIDVYDPTDDIKAMSAAQKRAALANLEKAYNQSVSDLNYSKQQIEPAYYAQRNNESADSQIAAKNFAEYMASRGMTNSGTAAQSEIANNVALQGNLGSLAKGEAAAYADNAKQLADLSTAYSSDKASTKAGIDASTMQSLINAQATYNAAKLAQANTDRAYNYQVGRDAVTDTGYTADGTQTLAGRSAQLQNDLNALTLKYQPQIYQGQIDAQTLQNAYQQLYNAGYPAQQAQDLAYKAAQTAAIYSSIGSKGGGGGSSKSTSSGNSSSLTSISKSTGVPSKYIKLGAQASNALANNNRDPHATAQELYSIQDSLEGDNTNYANDVRKLIQTELVSVAGLQRR